MVSLVRSEKLPSLFRLLWWHWKENLAHRFQIFVLLASLAFKLDQFHVLPWRKPCIVYVTVKVKHSEIAGGETRTDFYLLQDFFVLLITIVLGCSSCIKSYALGCKLFRNLTPLRHMLQCRCQASCWLCASFFKLPFSASFTRSVVIVIGLCWKVLLSPVQIWICIIKM